MKINQIQLFKSDKPTTLIVGITTDTGLTGWGECVLTSNEQRRLTPTHLAFLASVLINEDPRLVRKIYTVMDAALAGQPHLKSAIDVACWDIWGQAVGLPLYALLGGQFDESIPLAANCQSTVPRLLAHEISAFQQRGYHTFLLNMTGHLLTDIALIQAAGRVITPDQQLIVDGQGQWQLDDARKIIKATKHLNIIYQQPCRTFETCRTLQQRFHKAIVWNETLADRDMLFRAHEVGALDRVNLQLSREGGLTKAAETRDLCAQLFVPMAFGEPLGGAISLQALAHLSVSTSPRFRRTTLDNLTQRAHIFTPLPFSATGLYRLSTQPGLGITPKKQALGERLAIYREGRSQ